MKKLLMYTNTFVTNYTIYLTNYFLNKGVKVDHNYNYLFVINMSILVVYTSLITIFLDLFSSH